MPVTVTQRGSFKVTKDFLRRMQSETYLTMLERFGAEGVAALRASTPVESALTQESWYYEIVRKPGYFSIHWLNSHLVNPGQIPVAVLIQYGHATKNGGYVQGRDYINPAMRPIFDQIAETMWKEVTR